MIELQSNQLVVRFPEVHEEARLELDFQRTLRIPDDNREYPLPPGLGQFPLVHTEDFADRVPEEWVKRGGVILPIYQSEALWINFNQLSSEYPCAVKVAAGKINAITGERWSDGLHDDPQDYLVTPTQPWIDGFNVTKGRIRQFVAMPLGQGYSAEEQIAGRAEVGGLQIIVYPMKAQEYEAWRERLLEEEGIRFSRRGQDLEEMDDLCCLDLGLSPGGLMYQEIYEDEHGISVWDHEHYSRCFVHLANSEQYAEITGKAPPHRPPTAGEYTDAGLPWFDYYGADIDALDGSGVLANLDSVEAKRMKKGYKPDKANEPVSLKTIVDLGSRARRVKEGHF